MKHLVTGGSGFLGNLIARRLLAQGEEVRILDLWEDPNRPAEIEFFQADICDRNKVVQAMQGVDVVHHNVALVPLTKAKNEFHRVNVLGAQIAAEAAAKAKVRVFIHMSSSAIFGQSESPITLQSAPSPVEVYGRAKLAGEMAVSAALKIGQIPLIVIRPRTILGEGRLGIFHLLFDWIKQGKNVYVIGDGNVPFQFVHAHDLMDAYMLIMRQEKSGVYNVGTDRFGTLRVALENLIVYAGTKSKVKSLPTRLTINALRLLDILSLSPLAPWHYLTYHKAFYFDLKPLHDLGWKAKYSNDEMLRESYHSFLRTAQNETHSMASAHRSPVKEKILWLIKKLS
jgi:nucleoside-diphosphate-sugar epimerase